jgi:pilus assembly protein TadC
MDVRVLREYLYLASLVVGGVTLYISIVVFGFSFLDLYPRIEFGIIVNPAFNKVFLITLTCALVPVAVAEHLMYKRLVDIDDDLPMFLSTLSDAVKTGMDFIGAWEVASKGDSPVREACKKALKKIYMGINMNRALELFAEELGTKSARRVASIVTAAFISGGTPVETLDIAAKAFMDLDRFRKSRLTRMAPFIYISYVSIAIFLVSGYILVTMFLPATMNLELLGIAVYSDKYFYQAALFYASLVIAFSSALISSKLATGSVRPGVKHIIIMNIIIYVVFFIMIEGGYRFI